MDKSPYRTFLKWISFIAAAIFSVICGGIVYSCYDQFVSRASLSKTTSILAVTTISFFALFACLSLFGILKRLLPQKHGKHLKSILHSLARLLSPRGENSFVEHLHSNDFSNASKRLARYAGSLGELIAQKVLIFILISGIGTLLATSLALVHFNLANLQVQRLTEQNELLDQQNKLLLTQNNLLVDNDRTRNQLELAASRLDEIRSILLDSNSSIESQVVALKSIPSAMVLKVQSGNSIDYPNLVPLRNLLADYMRFDRIGHRLKLTGAKWSPGTPLPMGLISDLRSYEPISTEVLRILHVLGPDQTHRSLWQFTPNGSEIAPNARELSPAVLNQSGPLFDFSFGGYTLDLRHLPKDLFSGVQLPCAMRGKFVASIVFPENSEFEGCHFEGWCLMALFAKGAEFRHTQLDQSRFIAADLEGSSFSYSSLDGTALSGNLSGCTFSNTRINGVWWQGIRLYGTKFGDCSVNKSNLSQTKLDGCEFDNSTCAFSILTGTSMASGAILSSKFDGTKFDNATLIGTIVQDSEFIGCTFEDADLSKSRFTSVDLGGAEIVNSKFSGAQLDRISLKGSERSYRTETINAPRYLEDPPQSFITSKTSAGVTKSRLDPLADRSDEALDITVPGDSVDPIRVSVPGAALLGPTALDDQLDVGYIQNSAQFHSAISIWLSFFRHTFSSKKLDSFSSVGSNCWSRFPWNAGDVKNLKEVLAFESTVMGGAVNIKNANGAIDYMDFGSGASAAWLDDLVAREIENVLAQASESSPEVVAKIRPLVRKTLSTRDKKFLDRLEWDLGLALNKKKSS